MPGVRMRVGVTMRMVVSVIVSMTGAGVGMVVHRVYSMPRRGLEGRNEDSGLLGSLTLKVCEAIDGTVNGCEYR